MNIYEDYKNYIDECDELLETIKEYGKPVYYAIEDVLKATDYIYTKSESGLDEDLEEIFDIGFGFLSNVLNDMKTYLEEAFKNNKEVFEHYSELLLYSIYIEDFKSYLYAQELDTEDNIKVINQMLNKLDTIFTKNLEIPDDLVATIDTTLSKMGSQTNGFRPVYSVFQLIVEELDIE